MTIQDVYDNWCHVGAHMRYDGDQLYVVEEPHGVTTKQVCSWCIVQALDRADEVNMQRRLKDYFGDAA